LTTSEAKTQSIVLGGGCFWCLDAVYVNVQGVQLVESGYSNGTVARPSYEQVCSGNTGHAEVVKLVFDPQVISLREILEIFFVIHDPTTLNAQGNDHGTQYRSGIYFTDVTQQATAQQVLDELTQSGVYARPIVTELQACKTIGLLRNTTRTFLPAIHTKATAWRWLHPKWPNSARPLRACKRPKDAAL
jgi:peptide-methionine (S)-S-oxide reductase